MKRLDFWNLEQQLRKKARNLERAVDRAKDDDMDLTEVEFHNQNLGACYAFREAARLIERYRVTSLARTELFKRGRKARKTKS